MSNAVGYLFRVLILSLTFVSLVLQFLAISRCNFVALNDYSNTLTLDDQRRTVGLFYKSDSTGECYGGSFTTDDQFILAARSMISISILMGGLGGFMVFVETVLFDFMWAGLWYSLAYGLAWTSSALTFVFYGTKLCEEPNKETKAAITRIAGNVIDSETSSTIDFSQEPCEPMQSSHFVTAATVCYFVAAFLLCCAPHPEPLHVTQKKKKKVTIKEEEKDGRYKEDTSTHYEDP